MSTATDPYHEWNAAYVLGSLPPSERREYEQHLTECAGCARSVSSLAGMAGILASVPSDSAFALLTAEPREAPAGMLPKLLRTAARRRHRARIGVAAFAVAAAATVLVLAIPLLVTGEEPAVEPPPARIALSQLVPSPITAELALIPQSWGTRIDGVCRYAQPPDGKGQSWDYAMFVTTKDGTTTEIASWTASPGSELSFTAMTRLTAGQIGSIDIRLVDNGLVLLKTSY